MTGEKDYGDGYVVDVEYIDTFHAGLAPLDMAFAALLAGTIPPDPDRPFALLDLGCGNGFHAALIAAAHPHAQVWGVDFNAAHVRTARRTAEAAGLTNARFVEASFAALADRSLPPFDFVIAHGIWSWVSQANRDHIAALLERVVRPGGLVMVSYNCHPGWDAVMPLRHLLAAAAEDEPDPRKRVDHALRFASGLRSAGADYFRDNPAASDLLDKLADADPAYVAHEFFNANWTLFHPGEVSAALAPAGLTRVCSARAIDAFDRLWFTTDERALLERELGSTGAPMLRDLILDRRFRLDLFRRDGVADDRSVADRFADQRYVLARPRQECSLTVTTRVGETTLPADPAEALLDALAAGPATGRTLAASPRFENVAPEVLHDALAFLVATGSLRSALSEQDETARRQSTDRFNAAALANARIGNAAPALASPVSGTGELVGGSEQLLLDAIRFGIPLEAITMGDDPAATARFRDSTLPALTMLGIA